MEVRVKVAGLILNSDGHLLICKNKGKDVWISPGGKIEGDEKDIACLKRELKEEFSLKLNEAEFFVETPIELAAGSTDKFVIIKFYLVKSYSGDIQVNAEDSVEEFTWLSLAEYMNVEFSLGSGLQQFAIPKLIELNLIK